MRIFITALVLSLFVLQCFAQTLPNIGDTKQSVEYGLKNSPHNFIVSSSYIDKYTYSVGGANDYVVFIYYFRNSNTCTSFMIIPQHKDILLGLVEGYNESAIVVSPTEWRDYIEDKVISIKLLYNKENDFQYFQITD